MYVMSILFFSSLMFFKNKKVCWSIMDNQEKLSTNVDLTNTETSPINFSKIIAQKGDGDISAALGSNSEKDLSSNDLNCSTSPKNKFHCGWSEIFLFDEQLDEALNVQSYLSDSSVDENSSDDEFNALSSGRKSGKKNSCSPKQAPNFVITLQRILKHYRERQPVGLACSPQSFSFDRYLRWSPTPKEAIHVES